MGRRVLAVIGATATLVLCGVVTTGVAGAQQYTPAAITVDDSELCVTGHITVTGSGFPASSPVTVTVASPVATGTTSTDAGGAFSLLLDLPPDLSGTHTVRATSGAVEATSTLSSECPATPVAAAPPVAGGALPRTGSSSTGPLARLAIALIAAGGGVLALSRRRLGRAR